MAARRESLSRTARQYDWNHFELKFINGKLNPNKCALPAWDGVKRMPPDEQRAVYVVV
jgi:hypothetical protein